MAYDWGAAMATVAMAKTLKMENCILMISI
jgi:hypothetical protein